MPQVEERIASGSLNLTTLSMAQTLFRQNPKQSRAISNKVSNESTCSLPGANAESLLEKPVEKFADEKKLEILSKLENKSTRDAEKIVLEYLPRDRQILLEKVRPRGPDIYEVKFQACDKLLEKIEILKGLLAHSNPGITMAQLFEKLCDVGIERWDPSKKVKSIKPNFAAANVKAQQNEEPCAVRRKNDVQPITQKSSRSNPTMLASRQRNRSLTISTRRQVWSMANSKCENCGSKHALQVEHKIPLALGGSSEISNLKLLCRPCNQRAAIETYGTELMNNYLNRYRENYKNT